MIDQYFVTLHVNGDTSETYREPFRTAWEAQERAERMADYFTRDPEMQEHIHQTNVRVVEHTPKGETEWTTRWECEVRKDKAK